MATLDLISTQTEFSPTECVAQRVACQTVPMSSCLLLALTVFGLGMWLGRRPASETQTGAEDGTPIELDDPQWKQRFERPWS
ncbi:MAG: hypothetical protein CL450_02540 [Acidimicrobiaceae bacterium]|nr:hypothetical protein [Acidimicrobiaceae bacterium]